MRTQVLRVALTGLLLFLAFQACAPLPVSGGTDEAATALAATISVMQMTVSALQTLPTPSPTIIPSETPITPSTFTPTSTGTPIPFLIVTITPQPNLSSNNATVIHDALCWLGPGPGYVVSSALLNGMRVTLLGYGSISGWWVISDSIYHDPCWMYQED